VKEKQAYFLQQGWTRLGRNDWEWKQK